MSAARPDLPSGTITLLFTDVEGSTRLLHEDGAEAYAHGLAEHRRALREGFARHGGVEVDTQGDDFFSAFSSATVALPVAAAGQQALAEGFIRVRMGLHPARMPRGRSRRRSSSKSLAHLTAGTSIDALLLESPYASTPQDHVGARATCSAGGPDWQTTRCATSVGLGATGALWS
jgi:adenylate/guanylate cyclase family protein